MLIIPNASSTGGSPYVSLDQAEPDSLDIEVSGNIGRSGVLSGCVVTPGASAFTLDVTSGDVVLNGQSYPLTTTVGFALPNPPTDTRFDIAIARVSGGVATLTAVQGSESTTNPTFPASMSIFSGVFDPATNIDLETDVILASVYRQAADAITSAEIVDKRAMQSSTVMWQGASLPAGSQPEGTLFYLTSGAGGVASGLYVSNGSTWGEMAANFAPSLGGPIGSMIMWPCNGTLPTFHLEALGQLESKAVYPDLYAEYQDTHGTATGTHFYMPDMRDVYPKGVNGAGSNVGATGGSVTVPIAVTNLPVHSHDQSHSHTLSHAHGINHDHPGTSTDTKGGHYHTAGGGPSNGGFVILHNPSNSYFDSFQVAAGTSGKYTGALGGFPNQHYTGITESAGSHAHTFNVPFFTGSTTSQTTATTSTYSGPTGNTGSGTALTIEPPHNVVRYIVRAL